jgi:DNA-binding cell septation regulator SpoVG
MGNVKECEIVSIRKMDGAGNLKAFVDIRVGGALVITQCAVMDGKRGLFASLPRQLSRDGRWRDVVIAADDELRTHYQSEILKAYEEEAAEVANLN